MLLVFFFKKIASIALKYQKKNQAQTHTPGHESLPMRLSFSLKWPIRVGSSAVSWPSFGFFLKKLKYKFKKQKLLNSVECMA
jgi:hypothetical protein